ncbi:MAG TPA: hypothetical protein VFQ51_19630 [Vicinamibacteria bacterium]|nr:hypothetical protein [Vicinamibacteria bacterium]
MSAGDRRPGPLAGLLALHFVAGGLLVAGYRFQINPDGIAYIASARKYLAGHFADAATGFWSPLYTWLLAPLLALRVPPLLATKLLDLAAGALAIAAAWRLMGHLALDIRTRLAAGLTLVVVVLHFGLTVATPDLLSAALVLLYLAVVADPRWAEDRMAILAGLLAGAAYLGKAYALGFVVVHLALLTAVRLKRGTEARPRIVRSAAITLGALAIVVLPWALAISAKYGRFLLSDAGRLSWTYDGPSRPGYPMQRDGFIPPPDERAVSAWDDPGRLSLPDWSPWRSPAERRHFEGLVKQNLASIASIAQGFTLLALPITLAGIVLTASRFDRVPAYPVWTVVSAMLVYPTGYVVFHLRDRFLAIVCIVLLVVGALAAVTLARALRIGRIGQAIALALMCLSFLPAPIAGLRAAWRDGAQWPGMARDLQAVPIGARVASNGRWRQTLYVAFHGGWRYFGEPRPGATPDAVEADLRGHGVEYFLVWGEPSSLPFLARWPVVARSGTLTAYRAPEVSSRP